MGLQQTRTLLVPGHGYFEAGAQLERVQSGALEPKAWAEVGARPSSQWTVFGRAEAGAGQARVLGGVRYEW